MATTAYHAVEATLALHCLGEICVVVVVNTIEEDMAKVAAIGGDCGHGIPFRHCCWKRRVVASCTWKPKYAFFMSGLNF